MKWTRVTKKSEATIRKAIWTHYQEDQIYLRDSARPLHHVYTVVEEEKGPKLFHPQRSDLLPCYWLAGLEVCFDASEYEQLVVSTHYETSRILWAALEACHKTIASIKTQMWEAEVKVLLPTLDARAYNQVLKVLQLITAKGPLPKKLSKREVAELDRCRELSSKGGLAGIGSEKIANNLLRRGLIAYVWESEGLGKGYATPEFALQVLKSKKLSKRPSFR